MKFRLWLSVLMLISILLPMGVFADDHVDTAAQPVERPEAAERRSYTDQLQLESSSIRGNQELPKVLYIVPWQKSDPGDLMGRPGNTLLDEVLAPVDREEFIRQVEYYGDLYGETEE